MKSNFTNIFGKDIFFLALWFWKDLVGKNSNTRRLNLTYVTPILWFLISRIFFQYRIFLLPRCTAIHPVFLCTVCSIINSSSRQHKTLTPWPDAFSRKISFYIFRVTRRKRTASNSFFFFFIFPDEKFRRNTKNLVVHT